LRQGWLSRRPHGGANGVPALTGRCRSHQWKNDIGASKPRACLTGRRAQSIMFLALPRQIFFVGALRVPDPTRTKLLAAAAAVGALFFGVCVCAGVLLSPSPDVGTQPKLSGTASNVKRPVVQAAARRRLPLRETVSNKGLDERKPEPMPDAEELFRGMQAIASGPPAGGRPSVMGFGEVGRPAPSAYPSPQPSPRRGEGHLPSGCAAHRHGFRRGRSRAEQVT